MPNRSKEKGTRREREIVKALSEIPLVTAERIPLSGSAGGSFAGDLLVGVCGEPCRAEVKARARAAGWKTVKQWLGDNDLLFLVEDRKDPLVVVSWETFQFLLWSLSTQAEE